MKKILLLIIFFTAFANALSLEQVRNNLMKNLISMKMSVIVNGVETVVLVEILTLRHSKDFSDRLFEF